MQKMSARSQKWLKSIHILFCCMWAGSAISLNFAMAFMEPGQGMELFGATFTLKFIDDFILVPGAIGSLLTGLIYSLFTNWGWFKHRWITVKWCINLGGVIFGTFWLGPWINSLPPLAEKMGAQAYSDPVFQDNLFNLLFYGSIQAATIIFAVFISVLKPWKKARR